MDIYIRTYVCVHIYIERERDREEKKEQSESLREAETVSKGL